MGKIKVLEVTQVDLMGKRFNGYDLIYELDNKTFDIKQAVQDKLSEDDSVIRLMKTDGEYRIKDNFIEIEKRLSIKNILSITTPCLLKLDEYKEADIIHFHLFHNANLSLPFLKKISQEKKVILSIHDPWYLTGHCVHPLECDKWKNGCINCPHLDWYFSLDKDNSNNMWKLKENIFDNIDVDILVYSDWMMNLVKNSPIFKKQKRIHKISFGIDENKFRSTTKKEAREHYELADDSIVFFTRAQNGYKGTPYLLEALKELEVKDKNIVVLTCDNTNLLDEVKDKIQVIDLGHINDKEMSFAMNACDVFLMPSTAESFGLMAIEAMSCSKPVVVFNNSALPSVTHAPECGYLVKNCDSHDLMKTMEFIIDNPKDVEKRGKLAYSIVKKEYTLDLYNKKISDLYTKVYKQKKEYKEYNTSYKDNDNTIQFKFILNDFTIGAFGVKHPITEELLYSLNDYKRHNNYQFNYADKELQNLIIDYSIKMKDLYDKYKLGDLEIRKKVKIEKLLYFLKNNPKQIKNIIKNNRVG